MKIVYQSEEDIPVWRKEWFKGLSRDEQERLFMTMPDEAFKAEEVKLNLCQRIQEYGESSKVFTDAVWADIDYEQSFICLRYQDEESIKQLEETVNSVKQLLSGFGSLCSDSTLAVNGNSVSIEFEMATDEGKTTN